MLLVRTELRQSSIHGFGVFAREPIARGVKVWEFHPLLDVKIPPEVFDALPPAAREEIEIHLYEPEAGGPLYYEATMGKYMNHSRTPNVDFSQVDAGWAVCDIAAGDELTCDYRTFMADCSGIPYI